MGWMRESRGSRNYSPYLAPHGIVVYLVDDEPLFRKDKNGKWYLISDPTKELKTMSFNEFLEISDKEEEVTAYVATGLKFKILKWNFRVWKYGFEVGNNLGGRVYWFPWCKFFWKKP